MERLRIAVLGWSLLMGCGRFEFSPADNASAADASSADGSLDGAAALCPGHDEDGDGVGDSCDNCPSVPNATQDDRGELDVGASADGVGDACDPRPTIGGDRIAKFDAYDTDPMSSFQMSFGVVSWDGSDALLIGGTSSTGQAFFTSSTAFSRTELHYQLTALTPSSLVYFGLWTRITQNNLGNAVFAHVTDQTGDGQPSHSVIKEATGAGDLYSPQPSLGREFLVGDELRTIHDTELVTGSQQRFSVNAVTAGMMTTNELIVTRPFTGAYDLEAVNVGVRLESLVIYDVP